MEIIVKTTWNKNRTWGWCPKSEASLYAPDYYESAESRRITGCGYCKHSTAVADALNALPRLEKYLLEHQAILTPKYGIRFYAETKTVGRGKNKTTTTRLKAQFSGGVGTGCYQQAFEAIGAKWRAISGDNFEVITIDIPEVPNV